MSKSPEREEASMKEVTIVGIDLAKQVFQIHGASADGAVVFRKKLSRAQLVRFMADLPQCIVAMEACATAHHWGREMIRLGHEVRLIPPVYVKPFVKRQKNDASDAEAIAEAALRPTMRTVSVKTPAQQSRAMLFRTRELLVGQRTQMINALRGHLAEHGLVVAKGVGNVRRLSEIVADADGFLPELVREMSALYLDRIEQTSHQITALERRIAAEARQSDVARRLGTMPGIGPICAMAVETFAPAMETFRRGRDFSAWLGLVPRQHSSGGRQKLRPNVQDGPARHSSPADPRRHVRRHLEGARWRAARLMARPHAREEAAPAGRDRLGQQDGAHDLGDDDPRRGLQGSGRRGLLIRRSTPERIVGGREEGEEP
jgi:transposase